jgi:segregation and condensation protein B
MEMNQDSESRGISRLAALEAALYAAGRPIEIGRLKHVLRTKSDKVVLRLVRELAARYDTRDSALEVRRLSESRVLLQVRPKFTKMVKRITNRPLLTSGPLKTLSYIAYYQPVPQMKVISDRGCHIYRHLKLMEEMGLIAREKTSDREITIRTTPYFSDYFGFSEDPQKFRLQLHRMFSRMKIHKLDNGNGNHEGQVNTAKPSASGVEMLTDPGNRLPEGLAEYPGATHQGSK